jgi:hypothetical protein
MTDSNMNNKQFNGFDDDDAFGQTFFGGMRPNPMGFVNPNRGFSENYRCFPIAMMPNGNDRDNVNYGGKSIYSHPYISSKCILCCSH